MFNVANRATLVNIVELDKTVINGETMVHLYKINEVKHSLTMVKGTIGVTLLEVKVVKTMKRKSFTKLVGNGMPKVNVGPMDKAMVVVIVVGTILRTNVVNRIRSLISHIRWPTHNNMRGII